MSSNQRGAALEVVRSVVVAACLGLVVGCGASATIAPTATTPTTAPDPASAGPSVFGSRPERFDAPSRRAIVAVEAYERGGVDLAHARTVKVLRALADAFAGLRGHDAAALREARSATNELEWSRNTADERAERTRRALVALGRALPAEPERRDAAVAFGAARARLEHTAGRIDATRPAFMQRAAILDAFHAAVDALLLARGRDPLYQPSPDGAADEPAGPAGPRARSVDAARGAVRRLATCAEAELARQAAFALTTFADLLATSGGLSAEVAVIRSAADCARAAEGAQGEATRCVRQGLLAALTLLEHRYPGVPGLADWARDVRTILAELDEHRPLAPQRALVQDAFRATLDALIGFAPAGAADARGAARATSP